MSSHHRSSNEPSQRQLRVGEQIRHIIAETMQRGHFHDEALIDAGKITVTEVRVSPDLKNAKAFVMSLGGQNMEEILPALNDEEQAEESAEGGAEEASESGDNTDEADQQDLVSNG
jgi:ribosome-binding factor A